MYSLKHGNEMDNMDYSNLRNQGYYDQSAANQQNFLNASMQMNAAHMGLNDGLGGGGLENMIPRNDQNINYYQEYCRLFIANVVLTTQMKELISEKNELLTRLAELERGEKSVTKGSKTPELTSEKKSRIRRKAADVERHYKCPGSNCQKSYGSEGSLIQHVKLKHAELTDNPDWKVKILKLGEGEGGEGDADSQE